MDITYTYLRKRQDFGKQPFFCEVPGHLLDSISPDVVDQKRYCLRNPVHKEVQVYEPMSEHYVNTKQVVLHEQGINHSEGGWPEGVNYLDEEAVLRYKRRFERDDAYINAVLDNYKKLSHCIKQNNAIEMYEMYFDNMPPEQPVEKPAIFTRNVFRDTDDSQRPVACLDWTVEEDSKIVVAYCDKRYPVLGPINTEFKCYLWNVENPNDPCGTLSPPCACWQLACSVFNPSIIIGGLEDGRVCIFDIRASPSEQVISSPKHLAHRDPVSAVLYMYTRLGTEFFSGSTDGQCMWWDIRHINEPVELIIMSVRSPVISQYNLSNTDGVSALQFDRAFPTRFLCGTDTGLVVNVNRKGKSYSEIMTHVYHAHSGPVKAVHRSPAATKIFLTCGDWKVNIWSDEVTVSPIITGVSHRYQITDVAWAPQRISAYLSVSVDGKLRYWDLLRKYSEPVITFPIAKIQLLKIKPHDEGRLLTIGDKRGNVYLLSVSENLVLSGEKDKSIVVQMFDRETRRERILENRVKEIRLKQKTEEEGGLVQPVEEYDEELHIRLAEEEYFKNVANEMRNAGVAPGGTKSDPMRHR